MVDGHVSARKAEQIYDERHALRSTEEHVTKLEVREAMDASQGLPADGELAARLSAARSRRDEQAAVIDDMERAYDDWLRENT